MSILGGILLAPEVIGNLDTLHVDAFYDLRNRVVYTAMRNLVAADKPIDLTTLEDEIKRAGKLDAIGGVAYLGELALAVPTPDNVVAYAKVVRDHHMLRELALKASRAVERAYNWEYEADELLGETMADLAQLERGYREAGENIPVITVAQSLDEIERLSRTPIFETPFPELNRTLGFDGLLGGQVYYLAGGTGFGKTSFIATIVRAHAALGRQAIVAFYEMFSGYYTARMAAALCGVSANAIVRGRVDRHLVEANMPSTIEYLDCQSLSMVRRLAERHVRAGRAAPLIIVDYIQLLGDRIMATMARPDARLANAQASAGLRELAKETGSAVIAVSAAGRSVSRELSKDVRKRPARELIDASRESGSIEFDGAGVIVLSVSDDKDPSDESNIATISIAKARFGETRHIDARYHGKTGAWREIGLVATVKKVEPKPDDGSVRAAVVQVLLVNGPLGSKSQIHKLTRQSSTGGKNKTAVLSEIDAMIADRSLLYVEGKYVLPDQPPRRVSEPSQVALPEVEP